MQYRTILSKGSLFCRIVYFSLQLRIPQDRQQPTNFQGRGLSSRSSELDACNLETCMRYSV